MKKYMGWDKQTHKHTHRRNNTVNRPGLRAGSIEKYLFRGVTNRSNI